MAIQHVAQVPYRRVQGIPDLASRQVERNFATITEQLVPTGTMLPWAGQSSLDVPQGWLLCDGTAVNRNAFSSLFKVIGTEFGVGDGSTTFNVPNMSDRFPRGTHLGSEVGDVGGSADTTALHTHGMGNHTHFTSGTTGTESTGHLHHTTTGGISANHVHVGSTNGHSHTNASVVFMNCNAVHGHGGGCGQLSESPSGGGCTGFGCNHQSNNATDSYTTAGVSVDHTHSGWSGDVDRLHNHGWSGTSGGPSTNTTDGSSAGAGGGNLPPYMDFRFIIKT